MEPCFPLTTPKASNSMRRSLKTTAILVVTSASFVVGPALSAQAHDGRGSKSNKSADGTKTGRTDSRGSHKGRVVSAAVTSGTITQAQADAVNAAIKASTLAPSTSDAGRRTKYTSILAPLVSAGTVTQAQADALVNAIVTDGAGKFADGTKRSKGTKTSTSKA